MPDNESGKTVKSTTSHRKCSGGPRGAWHCCPITPGASLAAGPGEVGSSPKGGRTAGKLARQAGRGWAGEDRVPVLMAQHDGWRGPLPLEHVGPGRGGPATCPGQSMRSQLLPTLGSEPVVDREQSGCLS